MSISSLINLLFLFSLGVVLSFSSCAPDNVDPCENVLCVGGFCVEDGNCICDLGYSGADCSVYDSCHNVVCYNDGVCVSGTCDCPPGFTGAQCDLPKLPISMTIKKITYRIYPRYKSNGDTWDRYNSLTDSTPPDPYPTFNLGRLSDHGSYVAARIKDVRNMPPISYAGAANNLPYTVYNIDREHTLTLWDYDGGYNNGSDVMSAVAFVPENKAYGRPDSFNVETNNIWATLHIEWND